MSAGRAQLTATTRVVRSSTQLQSQLRSLEGVDLRRRYYSPSRHRDSIHQRDCVLLREGLLMPNYGGTQTQTNHSEYIFSMPIGTTLAWAGTGGAALPVGWVLCDGTAYLNTTYPALRQVIQQTHGDGTHTNTGASSGFTAVQAFNVPDHRGRFHRGADNMSGSSGARNLDDVSAAARFAANVGGSAGGVGSKEADQFQSHWHNMYAAIELNGSNSGSISAIGVPTNDAFYQGRDIATDPSYGTPLVGNETRPVNIAVVFIIKAF